MSIILIKKALQYNIFNDFQHFMNYVNHKKLKFKKYIFKSSNNFINFL